MQTTFPNNIFSSGQVDRELKGRYDLPIYQNGFEISKNFCHTIKGTTFFRTGTEFINEIGYAALHEFKFNQEQSYLLVFRIQYIEFFSYNADGEFVRVLDDNGNELTLVHPWGSEVFNLCVSQNCDVMYIQHLRGEYPEYQLKRTAANKFELSKTKYINSTTSLSGESATDGHGFPIVGCFYENRYQRCSSSKYYTYLYGSKGGSYDDITIGTKTNDGYQFDLAEAQSKALWIIGGSNSLLIGTAEGVLTVNGGSAGDAITPESVTAKLSCRDGCAPIMPIRKDNAVFFVSANKRKLFMFNYDVLLEQFKAVDLSKANYEITKGGIKKIAYKDDNFGFMYAICGDDLLCISFSEDENVNGWSKLTTKGQVVDICTLTKPNGEKDLFLNIKRVVNNIERYYLERLSDWVEYPRREDYLSEITDELDRREILNLKQLDEYAFQRAVAQSMRDCVYLDCSIKYDGLQKNKISINGNIITAQNDVFSESDVGRRISIKTISGYEYGIFDIEKVNNEKEVKVKIIQQTQDNLFDEWYLSSTIFLGLEHLEGESVSVVGNGGYIGDFVVQDGKIDVSSANTNKLGSAVIGLKYKGILKSCNLGMQYQGGQSYTKNKNITSIDFTFSFSAGGKTGSSLYNLKDIQFFDSDGMYDMPALPMNTIEKILIDDTYDEEKHFYVVQDKPLPMHILMITPEYKHVVNG